MSEKIWSDDAWEDYLYWQSQDKKTLKRINQLIKDIERNGCMEGIGKPALYLAIYQASIASVLTTKIALFTILKTEKSIFLTAVNIITINSSIQLILSENMYSKKVPSALSTPLPLTHEGFWGFSFLLF